MRKGCPRSHFCLLITILSLSGVEAENSTCTPLFADFCLHSQKDRLTLECAFALKHWGQGRWGWQHRGGLPGTRAQDLQPPRIAQVWGHHGAACDEDVGPWPPRPPCLGTLHQAGSALPTLGSGWTHLGPKTPGVSKAQGSSHFPWRDEDFDEVPGPLRGLSGFPCRLGSGTELRQCVGNTASSALIPKLAASFLL